MSTPYVLDLFSRLLFELLLIKDLFQTWQFAEMGNTDSREMGRKAETYTEKALGLASSGAKQLGACISRDTGSHTDDVLK